MINLLSPFLGHTEVLCEESGTLGSKTPSNKPAELVTIYQQEVQKCLRKLTGIEGGRMHDPSNCTTPSNCTSNLGGCESKHGVKVHSPGKLMIILWNCVSLRIPMYPIFRQAIYIFSISNSQESLSGEDVVENTGNVQGDEDRSPGVTKHPTKYTPPS